MVCFGCRVAPSVQWTVLMLSQLRFHTLIVIFQSPEYELLSFRRLLFDEAWHFNKVFLGWFNGRRDDRHILTAVGRCLAHTRRRRPPVAVHADVPFDGVQLFPNAAVREILDDGEPAHGVLFGVLRKTVGYAHKRYRRLQGFVVGWVLSMKSRAFLP